MSAMRVTNVSRFEAARTQLQANAQRLQELQTQASSQKAIGRPSDDPAGTAASMATRAAQRASEQYSRNADDGLGWLSAADTALSGVSSLLRTAGDRLIQAANGATMTPASREAIASELETLRDDLLASANASYLGRSVFAGTADGPAFAADGYAFAGAAGASVDRRIGPTTTVRVDVDGAAVFGTPGTPPVDPDDPAVPGDSVFELLDRAAAAVRAGEPLDASIAALGARRDQVLAVHGAVGTAHAQLLRAKDALAADQLALEAQRSGIEDVDFAKVLLDLETQNLVYQSALQVTSRVLQPTLMEFLR